MMARYFALLMVLVLMLTGCAKGIAYRPVALEADEAVIYIYRPKTPIAAAVVPDIMVNGQMIGTLRAGGYRYIKVAPGNYVVTGKTIIGHNVPLELNAGDVAYVKVSVTPTGTVIGPVIRKVDDYTGRTEIRHTDLVYE